MSNNSGKVTMYTIAAEVGMSIAAVSRAFDPKSRLKPEKRQLILETAARLGYSQNKLAARLSREAAKIGVLIYGVVPEFYNEYVSGIRDAYDEFADYKVTLDLNILPVSEYSSDDAYRVIDSFIENGMEGIIISGLSQHQHLEKLNKLVDSGISLIVLNTDLPGCRRHGVSMNDVDTAGRMAAQLLRCAMGKPGRAVIFAGSEENMSQKGIVSSFCNSAPTFSVETAAVFYTDNNPELSESIARDILTNRRDIEGIYVSTANSIPICRVIEEMGLQGRIGVVASDVFSRLNDYIRSGTVFATIDQNPFMQARSAFESLFYNLTEGTPIREFTLARPQAVFVSNLNLYEK